MDKGFQKTKNLADVICVCFLCIDAERARRDAVHAELAKLDPRVELISARGVRVETVDEFDGDVVDQTDHPFNLTRGKNWGER